MESNVNNSSSTCVREGCCGAEKTTTIEVEAEGYVPYGGASSAEFEFDNGVDWIPDNEAEGDDDELCWVPDDAENGADVEAERDDDDMIIEEVIEGGYRQNDARVEEFEDSDEEVQNEWERKRMGKRTINKMHEIVCNEDFDDGTERFIFENRVRATRFLEGQFEEYETKINDLKKRLDCVTEGFRAALRMEEKEREHNRELVKRNSDLVLENWRLSERIARLVEEN